MMKPTEHTQNPTLPAAVRVNAETLDTFETSPGLLSRLWRWLSSLRIGKSGQRRLQVADTVSLGDKRFVAVVEVDGRHFLLAGGPTNIALLAQLNEKDDFGEVLEKTMHVPGPPAAAIAQPLPAVTAEPCQEEEKRPRKRPARPKKKAPATAASVPKRAKAVSPSKKPSTVAAKKQPRLAANRSSKPVVAPARFGDIAPAQGGVRAFEQWLGRALPTAPVQPAPAKPDPGRPAETKAESVNTSGSLPLPPKSKFSERLQEVLPMPDKPVAEAMPVPVTESKIEEYA